MLSLNRTKVMSIPEFLQECERERLEKQYNLTNLDKIIGHIKRNKRLYRRLVFNVALTCLLMNIDLSIAYASAVNVDDAIRKIEEITDQLLKFVVDNQIKIILGGGNIVDAAVQAGYKDKVYHASTGGVATLEFIGGTSPLLDSFSLCFTPNLSCSSVITNASLLYTTFS